MNKRAILFSVFVLVSLVQLYVPASMIFDREDIMANGKEFKFKTEPVDPYDPFRGKYIILNYKEDIVKVRNTKDWSLNETIYVFLSMDNDGYARVDSASKSKPANDRDFIKVKVSYPRDSSLLNIDFPFDRFYMEESKAGDAEVAYRASLRDTNQVAFGLVSIKDGEAVLKDVMIDGIPIKEVVRKNKK